MDKKVSLTQIDIEKAKLLKGIAILYVLLGHMHYINWGGGGVGLFLIVSGYGINETVKRNGVANYWAKRIKAVYLPYFFVMLLFLVSFQERHGLTLLCTVLSLDFGYNVDNTMWYISFIFYWYIVYYASVAVSHVFKNEPIRTLVKAFEIVFAVPVCIYLSRRGVWHEAAAAEVYALLFPIGVLLSDLSGLKVDTKVRQIFWAVILFVCTARLLSAYPFIGARMRISMPMQAVAVCMLADIGGRPGEVLKWFGNYSFSIYLFEGVFVFTYRNSWFEVLGNQILIDAAAIAVTMIFAWIYQECIISMIKKIPLETISLGAHKKNGKETV